MLFVCLYLFLTACNTPQRSIRNPYANALIKETSLYLRQHAHNPVNWQAWQNETQTSDSRLRLISIGYAACHWCHVMERETFSDTSVANLMNAHFTNIKIDREERPDIDNVYMRACQLTKETGCGWPLNVIALPDGKPVWVGTYTPKAEFLETLNYFIKAKHDDLDKLKAYAEQFHKAILSNSRVAIQNPIANIPSVFDPKDVPFAIDNVLKTTDFNNGGQIGIPKFPMPVVFDFLLSQNLTTNNNPTQDSKLETQNEKILRGVKLTLDKLANGGIYDQIGGGFHRYAVDSLWQVPHFEKMLYDNAQLISLYSHAFQLTQMEHSDKVGNKDYEKVIRQTMAFVKQNWLSKEGGFYSSYDADTEGGEGEFYTWTKSELDKILGQNATFFNNFYENTEGGNFEKGRNILYTKKNLTTVATLFGLTEQSAKITLDSCKNALLKNRNQRPKPNLDDKIITSWDALMLKGCVNAYRALGDKTYLRMALQNADFITQKLMDKNGKLKRHFTKGKAQGTGFLEDYAYTLQAFLSLYEITFNEKWIYEADKLTAYVLQNFEDKQSAFYHFSENNSSTLIARPLTLTDDVLPNPNGIFAQNLQHLGILLDKKAYLDKAEAMLKAVYKTAILDGQTAYYVSWAKLFQSTIKPPFEVAIVGQEAAQLREELARHYLPNVVILGQITEGGKKMSDVGFGISGQLPLLENKFQKGQTWIYVCENKACKLPVKTVKEALKLLGY